MVLDRLYLGIGHILKKILDPIKKYFTYEVGVIIKHTTMSYNRELGEFINT